MIKKILLPLFFIVISILFYKFGVLSNKEKAIGAFTFGNIQSENIDNCTSLSGFEVFCREGFILKKIELSFQNIDSFLKVYPIESLLALGMYHSSKFNSFNDQLINKYENLPNRLFIIDGWSFGRIVIQKTSPSDMINQCDQIVDSQFKRACFFGAGRAIYFTNKSLIDLEIKNEVKLGFYFAKRFAGKDDNSESVESVKLAAEYEMMLSSPKQNVSNKCVSNFGYFLDCL